MRTNKRILLMLVVFMLAMLVSLGCDEPGGKFQRFMGVWFWSDEIKEGWPWVEKEFSWGKGISVANLSTNIDYDEKTGDVILTMPGIADYKLVDLRKTSQKQYLLDIEKISGSKGAYDKFTLQVTFLSEKKILLDPKSYSLFSGVARDPPVIYRISP